MGNIAAVEAAAVAFTTAGGTACLVSVTAGLEPTLDGGVALQALVLMATLAHHATAAAGLLAAGGVRVLSHAVSHGVQTGLSIATLEPASLALALLLRIAPPSASDCRNCRRVLEESGAVAHLRLFVRQVDGSPNGHRMMCSSSAILEDGHAERPDSGSEEPEAAGSISSIAFGALLQALYNHDDGRGLTASDAITGP